MRSFKPRPNFFWSTLSVAGVLILLAVFALITLHSHDLVDAFKEQFEVVVELGPSTEEGRIESLIDKLSDEKAVLDGSVVFISKEEGLKRMSKELGEDLLVSEMPNPLFDVVSFHLSAESFGSEAFEAMASQYRKEYGEILDIYYESALIEQVTSNLNRMSIFFLLAGGVLIFFAVTLMHNSIRLSIYANRFLIKNMELVGASWGFIRRPFLKKSIGHGMLSAIISLLILIALIYFLWLQVPEIIEYMKIEYLIGIAVGVFVVGMIINLSSTWYVVTRFLKMRLSELHS